MANATDGRAEEEAIKKGAPINPMLLFNCSNSLISDRK
jgi:hypothetical protein